jgi:hypothetical protein
MTGGVLMVVEFGCSNRWTLTTGSVEEEACSSSDRCSRPINACAAEEFPGSVTVGQLAEARTETGSSETITRLVGRPSAAACCRFRCSGIDSKQSVGERKKKQKKVREKNRKKETKKEENLTLYHIFYMTF